MKILINFANRGYYKAQRMNTWSGKKIAKFDKVYSFSPEDIDIDFYCKHQKILDEKRGCGLWLWKPYFINKVLNICEDGDIVFYCDSGAFFIRNIEELIKSMRTEEDIWVSDNPLLECCFTKKRCFELMGCVGEKYEYTNQVQATYLMLRCSEQSKQFVREWLFYCCNKEIMWPETNETLLDNNPLQFVSHREDQSILSLLCKKYGLTIHRDPSQRGIVQTSYYNPLYAFQRTHHSDIYKTAIFLHKSGDVSILHIIRVLYYNIKQYTLIDRKECK